MYSLVSSHIFVPEKILLKIEVWNCTLSDGTRERDMRLNCKKYFEWPLTYFLLLIVLCIIITHVPWRVTYFASDDYVEYFILKDFKVTM